PASAGVAPISSRNRTIEAIRRVRGTFAGSASNAMESVLLIQSRMLYIAIRRYVKVTLQDLSELLGMEDAVEDSVGGDTGVPGEILHEHRLHPITRAGPLRRSRKAAVAVDEHRIGQNAAEAPDTALLVPDEPIVAALHAAQEAPRRRGVIFKDDIARVVRLV